LDTKNITDIVDLLDAYRALKNQQQVHQYERLTAGLARMKDGLETIREQTERERRPLAPDFNIFRILHVERNEVYTHSSLLYDLLSPLGSHAQGNLFLEAFLQMVAEVSQGNFALPASPLAHEQWHVEREHWIREGHLDLVITGKTGHLVVIENKIGAREQEDQLHRYASWMERRRSSYPAQALVYLTPDGGRAWTAKDAHYLQLSYEKDITGWLTGCLAEVQAPRVRETLAQYIELIHKLC